MAEATVPYGRKTQRPPAVKEVHIVWITAGLGCDGDSVSITAATNPSGIPTSVAKIAERITIARASKKPCPGPAE